MPNSGISSPIRTADAFSRAADWTARQCGRGSTFGLACLSVVAWAATGPLFHFSDTWQLIINTGTTIVTFLMVFLLQHAQNRDAATLQQKLDELIRRSRPPGDRLSILENLPTTELDEIRAALARLDARRNGNADFAQA